MAAPALLSPARLSSARERVQGAPGRERHLAPGCARCGTGRQTAHFYRVRHYLGTLCLRSGSLPNALADQHKPEGASDLTTLHCSALTGPARAPATQPSAGKSAGRGSDAQQLFHAMPIWLAHRVRKPSYTLCAPRATLQAPFLPAVVTPLGLAHLPPVQSLYRGSPERNQPDGQEIPPCPNHNFLARLRRARPVLPVQFALLEKGSPTPLQGRNQDGIQSSV